MEEIKREREGGRVNSRWNVRKEGEKGRKENKNGKGEGFEGREREREEGRKGEMKKKAER